MRNDEKVLARNRCWLNPVSSYNNGWIKYEIIEATHGDRIKLETDFILADCSRTISMDFNGTLSLKKDRKMLINKAKKFKDEISKFCDIIIERCEREEEDETEDTQ